MNSSRAGRAFLTIVGSMILCAGVAQAIPSAPKKAKKFKVNLVQSYNECGGTTTNDPNTFHNQPLPLPACNPAVTTAALSLGPDAVGSVEFGAVAKDVKIKVKINDV